MSHIGIFGGTFDPIHNGHLITVINVLDHRNLDKIIFVPCFISPLKTGVDSSSADDRLKMVQLAIKDVSRFECSDYEIKNKGVSFTIDTIKHFKQFYDEIDLIIGYDNIASFNKWKDPDKIFNLANVVVLRRNIDTESGDNKYLKRAVVIDTPIIDISSTKIREKVKNNLPIDHLVPETVKSYIKENNLYRNK
ncbi:MAG: nicotinate (nicotinamide) nucleotide adenylyltransferase [Melioribacteraceae bacterium]|nr:nicotinate (nicotinamide) nucleotide adenylyltransferase [Melioribacteraceae bacterium]